MLSSFGLLIPQVLHPCSRANRDRVCCPSKPGGWNRTPSPPTSGSSIIRWAQVRAGRRTMWRFTAGSPVPPRPKGTARGYSNSAPWTAPKFSSFRRALTLCKVFSPFLLFLFFSFFFFFFFFFLKLFTASDLYVFIHARHAGLVILRTFFFFF